LNATFAIRSWLAVSRKISAMTMAVGAVALGLMLWSIPSQRGATD
jgi:hypothetical protein